MLSRHRVAKQLDAVVCALHFGILTGNNFAHRCGEIFLLHRLFIFLDRGIFASLALCQDGVIIAFSDGGLKIDPGPMHRTRGTAAVLGFAFTQSYRLALQFTGKTGTLQRILVENRLKFRIFHCFRSLTETFLSVLQRFDEIVDCRDCFLLLSHTKFRIRSAFRVHHFLRDLPQVVIFLMNKKGKDLTKEPPRSPKTRVGGYAILGRTIDKCRALLWGNIGEYHFDCPLDNMLFGFKGIKGDDFKAFVESGASDDEIAQWVDRSGTPKSEAEKRTWSEKMLKVNPYQDPEKCDWYVEQLQPLGLDPKTTPLFDWLETDDKVSYKKAA